MGCIYQNNCDDYCQMALNDDGEFEKDLEQQGSENGICVVSEDPDPSMNCDTYESDSMCPECDTDLNVEDCDC